MAAQLLEHLSATHRYLKANASTASSEAVQEAQAKNTIGKLDLVRTWSLDEAAKVLESISAGPWEARFAEQLRARVNELATKVVGAPTSAHKNALQSLLHLENYLSKGLWEALRSGVAQSTKLQHLCDFLLVLGLRHPTERSAPTHHGFLHPDNRRLSRGDEHELERQVRCLARLPTAIQAPGVQGIDTGGLHGHLPGLGHSFCGGRP